MAVPKTAALPLGDSPILKWDFRINPTNLKLAESQGFEPWGLLHPVVFKTTTINHSDNFPYSLLVARTGLEPITPTSSGWRSTIELSSQEETSSSIWTRMFQLLYVSILTLYDTEVKNEVFKWNFLTISFFISDLGKRYRIYLKTYYIGYIYQLIIEFP